MKCFYRFLGEVNKTNVQILDLPPKEFDHLLGKFFKDVRKTNGEKYEPSSFTGLQRSIQRFLSDSVTLFRATTKINIHLGCH